MNCLLWNNADFLNHNKIMFEIEYWAEIWFGLIFGELISEFKFWRSLFFCYDLGSYCCLTVNNLSKTIIWIQNSHQVDLTKSNLLKWTTLILKSVCIFQRKEEKEDLWFISLVFLFFNGWTCIGCILCNHGLLFGFYMPKTMKFLLCQKCENKPNLVNYISFVRFF